MKKQKTSPIMQNLLPDSLLQNILEYLPDPLPLRMTSTWCLEGCQHILHLKNIHVINNITTTWESRTAKYIHISGISPMLFAQMFDPAKFPSLLRIKINLRGVSKHPDYVVLFQRAFHTLSTSPSFKVEYDQCPKGVLQALLNHPRAGEFDNFIKISEYWYPKIGLIDIDSVWGAPYSYDTLKEDIRSSWMKLHGSVKLPEIIDILQADDYSQVLAVHDQYRRAHLESQLSDVEFIGDIETMPLAELYKLVKDFRGEEIEEDT